MTPRYLRRYREQNPPPPGKKQRRLAEYLRRMPPLQHNPFPERTFRIGNSEVIRFIIFAMGGSLDERGDWSKALRIFNQARGDNAIFYNRSQNTWEGSGFVPGTQPPHVGNWLKTIKLQTSRRARQSGKRHHAGNHGGKPTPMIPGALHHRSPVDPHHLPPWA